MKDGAFLALSAASALVAASAWWAHRGSRTTADPDQVDVHVLHQSDGFSIIATLPGRGEVGRLSIAYTHLTDDCEDKAADLLRRRRLPLQTSAVVLSADVDRDLQQRGVGTRMYALAAATAAAEGRVLASDSARTRGATSPKARSAWARMMEPFSIRHCKGGGGDSGLLVWGGKPARRRRGPR